MNYIIEETARTLKAARQRKNLSQRELAEKVGVPQSHISKIENARVDLQLSSLIEFARVLDLELTLVPRELVPAVQSMVRGAEGTGPMKKAIRELDRLRALSDELARRHDGVEELTRISRVAEQLKSMPAVIHRLDEIERVTKALKRIQRGDGDPSQAQEALTQLQLVRARLAHEPSPPRVAKQPAPAYRLDEDEADGDD